MGVEQAGIGDEMVRVALPVDPHRFISRAIYSAPVSELRLDIRGFEVARGHDGFLRGDVEPVVILGVFAVFGEMITLLERWHHQFQVSRPYPNQARSVVFQTAHRIGQAAHFAFLAVALEEDGGEDIRRVYAALEAPEELQVWESGDHHPTPLKLTELHHHSFGLPSRVVLHDELGNFGDRCASDKWIGASSWVSAAPHGARHMRSHFRSEDRLNDWTMEMVISHQK